jgi:DNA (cytosine-5)-methyltransferase 1
LPDVVGTLSDGAHNGGGLNGQGAYSGRVIAAAQQRSSAAAQVAMCLTAGMPRLDAETETLIPTNGGSFSEVVGFHPTQDPISSTDGSIHAMGCGSKNGACTQAVAFKPLHFTRGKDGAPSEVAAPLSADADKGDQDTVVSQAFTYSGYSNQPAWMTGGRTDCLPASGHNDGSRQGIGILSDMAVRRLTPRECERLQGFPDDYTNITYRKKPASDRPRYKALGNSMAVPCMHWMGLRIGRAFNTLPDKETK